VVFVQWCIFDLLELITHQICAIWQIYRIDLFFFILRNFPFYTILCLLTFNCSIFTEESTEKKYVHKSKIKRVLKTFWKHERD